MENSSLLLSNAMCKPEQYQHPGVIPEMPAQFQDLLNNADGNNYQVQ